MDIMNRFSLIKETQHYKSWNTLIDQIHELQNERVFDQSNPSEKAQLSTNPFVGTDNQQLVTINSMQTVPFDNTEEKSKSKNTSQVVFYVVLQGIDATIQASARGNSVIMKSDRLTCRGAVSEEQTVKLVSCYDL